MNTTIGKQIRALRKQLLQDSESAVDVAAYALGIASAYAQAHTEVVKVVTGVLDDLSHSSDQHVTTEQVADLLHSRSGRIVREEAAPVLVIANTYENAFRAWEKLYGKRPGGYQLLHATSAEALKGHEQGTPVMVTSSAINMSNYIEMLNTCSQNGYFMVHCDVNF